MLTRGMHREPRLARLAVIGVVIAGQTLPAVLPLSLGHVAVIAVLIANEYTGLGYGEAAVRNTQHKC